MLLEHSLGMTSEAEAIRRAVDVVVREGYRTPDIAAPGARMVGCKAMGRLVRERLESAEADV
jgi:3-isopropylmalate dehydrogenase